MIWLILPALATRPDQGGINAFDSSDVLATLDGQEGLVRVTYSISGPNVTLLDDDDQDGIPDFPALVAKHAEAVLDMYAEMGFRAPISEADMGLELGGSPAFDFYLVDFGGTADGQFLTDRCDGQVCSGFMVMENDFTGYGYPTREAGIQTLTSHELFHAVQAAYRSSQEVWMAEGTATWSEHQYDPDNTDFYYLCDALLEDPGRPFYEPPAGPIPAFAYGTALFWQFLTERYGTAAVVSLMESEDDVDGMDAVEATLSVLGTDWATEWPIFVKWNLATGSNSGETESYPFASHLKAVSEEDTAQSLQDDNRFYPLAATYYTLKHPGGPLYFSTSEDPSGLFFGLHPVGTEGVQDPLLEWAPLAPGTVELGDFPAGTYKFWGAYAARADQSNKLAFCLGDATVAAACVPEEDTGEVVKETAKKEEGCGCSEGGRAGAGWWMLLSLLGLQRRGGQKRSGETRR